MCIKLSKQSISTFCGDIATLQLVSDIDLSNAPIKWETTDDTVVSIREFCEGKCSVYQKDGSYSAFNDGILLTMLKSGDAKITASLNGETYSCDVSVRAAKSAKVTDKFNHYIRRIAKRLDFKNL